MRNYSRYITLIGGLLAFFSFALPWVGVYSGVNRVIGGFHLILVILMIFWGLICFGIFYLQSISRALGIVIIAIGLFFFLILLSIFFEVVKDFDQGSSFVTLAFFASLVIIGSSLLLNRQGHLHSFAKVFVFSNACIGFLCFLIVVFSLNLDLKIAGSFNPIIKYGAFLTAVGFVLSVVGVFETPILENDDVNKEENQSNV